MVYRCITVTWMPILQLSDPISSSPAEQAKSPAEPGLTIFEINTYDHSKERKVRYSSATSTKWFFHSALYAK